MSEPMGNESAAPAPRSAHPQGAGGAQGWWSSSPGSALVLTIATGLALYVCYRLTLPFLPPLTWALAVAVLFSPFHRRIEAKLRHPNLAATVSVILIGLIVVIPALFVGQRLLQEAVQGADSLRAKVESGAWQRGLDAYPILRPLIREIERRIDLPGTVDTVATHLGNVAAALVRGSVVQALQLVLIFYMAFYFLRDRREAITLLRSLAPLSATEMDRLLARVGDTIFATFYGTLAVAGVQGLLGGLMFWWLGLPAPMLWGVIMGLLAIVPVLGAFVVWIPAAIFLALEGRWGAALLLTAWGGVLVGGIDNLLYPMLVGSRLQLHTLLAFIAMVGGLLLFGSSGLILGPVLLTLTQSLLEVVRGRNGGATAEG